jgi:Kef-type K+ transport system membrane component KefB
MRIVALAIVIATVFAVQQLPATQASGARTTALALGFALIAALLTGDLVQRLRLPRVTGYLLLGLLCGPYLARLISGPMARELSIFNGLAVALIAFVSGLEMNLARMRAQLGTLLRLGAVSIAVIYAGLFVAFFALWPWLPIAPEAGIVARTAFAALLATLVVSFSPTVTIAVIAESRARGPFSTLVLSVTILGDLILILLFALSMQFVRWSIGHGGEHQVGLLVHLLWEIVGSISFGAIVGAAFGLYLKYVGRELTVMLLALCAVLSEAGHRLLFEPVLAALSAGLVVENIAPPAGDALKESVERGALPILVIFFAAAGASLNIAALAQLGVLAVSIAALRLLLIRVGSHVATRRVSAAQPHAELLWMGLVSQAGVTLGLTFIVAAEFPEWGSRVQTLMVALIALHQLAGPVLFRAALARTGEIGRMDAPART